MRDAVAFLQNKAEDERNAGNADLARDFAECAAEITALRDDVANRIIITKGYSDELERLRAALRTAREQINRNAYGRTTALAIIDDAIQQKQDEP